MYQIARTGSIAEIVASARDVPARVIPYAAAAALTKTAKAGQKAIIAQMPRAFDSPTRYTLNATRIDPATKDTLRAMIAVKDQAGGRSTRPESYLLPEVDGGGRKAKRFEAALRYMGVLSAGEYVMPGAAAKLDANGNVKGAEVSQILTALKAVRGGVKGKGQRAGRGRGRALKNDLFVGVPTVGRGAGRRARVGGQFGIYRREGKRLRPLFIVTSKRPTYEQRLDFDGTVAEVVRERFSVEFERAARSITRKFSA